MATPVLPVKSDVDGDETPVVDKRKKPSPHRVIVDPNDRTKDIVVPDPNADPKYNKIKWTY